MTIAHSFWCPRHLYLDRPSEIALVHHVLLILGPYQSKGTGVPVPLDNRALGKPPAGTAGGRRHRWASLPAAVAASLEVVISRGRG
jgi:hypothetical protein